jgi:hypothetical protein
VPARRQPVRYDGLRREAVEIARALQEVWDEEGPLVCCLGMPVALTLVLGLEVVIRLGLFNRLQVQRFFDGNSENARRDEVKLRLLDRQLAGGYSAHFTAEGGFVMRRARPGERAAAERKLRELMGEPLPRARRGGPEKGTA